MKHDHVQNYVSRQDWELGIVDFGTAFIGEKAIEVGNHMKRHEIAGLLLKTQKIM